MKGEGGEAETPTVEWLLQVSWLLYTSNFTTHSTFTATLRQLRGYCKCVFACVRALVQMHVWKSGRVGWGVAGVPQTCLGVVRQGSCKTVHKHVHKHVYKHVYKHVCWELQSCSQLSEGSVRGVHARAHAHAHAQMVATCAGGWSESDACMLTYNMLICECVLQGYGGEGSRRASSTYVTPPSRPPMLAASPSAPPAASHTSSGGRAGGWAAKSPEQTQKAEERGQRPNASAGATAASSGGGRGGGGDGDWVHIGAQEASGAAAGKGVGGTKIATLSASLKEKLPSVGKFG